VDDEAFEWSAAKAAANWRDHGVAFPAAVRAFRDPFAIERIDERQTYGEERVNLIAMCDGTLLHVPTRSEGSGSGSSPLAGRIDMSKTPTIAKIRPDGVVVEVLTDGTERPFAVSHTRPMTPDEVAAAACKDPDARPMTPQEWTAAPRVPRTRTLRRALGLTQEEFCARYHIPLDTLRDWEQGRSEPDQPARAYLAAIAGDPEGVCRALNRAPR